MDLTSSLAPSTSVGGTGGGGTTNPSSGYICPTKKYTKCKPGYRMVGANGLPNPVPEIGNKCVKCADDDEECLAAGQSSGMCGTDYAGSLYQKLVRYALQVCIRPEDSSLGVLPTSVLADVNMVMDSIRVSMANVLAAECSRLGGYWVSTIWVDDTGDSQHDSTGHTLFQLFYNETGANKKWGYCADPQSVEDWDKGWGYNDNAGGGSGDNNSGGDGGGNPPTRAEGSGDGDGDDTENP